VTIEWNASGFHLVKALPNGWTWNTKYCCNNILTVVMPFLAEAGERKLILDADNPTPQSAEKCPIYCAENGL
jgi:hypothetical protein